MDYQRLNKITIKNKYSLFLVFELLDQLSLVKIYINIDLDRTYNLIVIEIYIYFNN